MKSFKTKELGAVLAAANDGIICFEYNRSRFHRQATKLLALNLLSGYDFISFNIENVLLENNLEDGEVSANISLYYDDEGTRIDKEREKEIIDAFAKELQFHTITCKEV